MYLPKSFNAPEHAWQLVQSHPLGQLISVDPQGLPFLSWLPFHVESQGQADSTGSSGVLLGHLAKANPHVQLLAERPEVTAVFMGPHAYMPTTVYADSLRVPTWSYLVVQMRLKSILVEGEAAKDVLLKQLIGDHQPPYAAQWRGLPADFTERMLQGIVAYRFEVLEIQSKFKLNQHRKESHVAMHAHYAQGSEAERELAQWMTKLGLVGGE